MNESWRLYVPPHLFRSQPRISNKCFAKSPRVATILSTRDLHRFEYSDVPYWCTSCKKIAVQALLERLIREYSRLVTDAEVFQEILHRYAGIGRRDAIQATFNALEGIVDDTFTIDRVIVEEAKRVVLAYQTLSARDAVHVAVMQKHGITTIASFDGGFDAIPYLKRIIR